MIMRVRKFGEAGPWVEVEHVPVDQCGFCAVAQGNLKAVGHVIFFETADGHVQRTECIGLASDGSPAFECWESDREEAQREIAEAQRSLLRNGFEHVSERVDLGVSFIGCRVEVLDHAEMMHPAALPSPVFMIEPLGPCDGLLVTSVRVGNGDNLLAVVEVPAALFEEPPAAVLNFPPLHAGVQLRLEFANRAKEPASFLVWLGSQQGINAKWQRLQDGRVARKADRKGSSSQT
jgi:hypothetical protein